MPLGGLSVLRCRPETAVFEHRADPHLPRRGFLRRQLLHAGAGGLLVVAAGVLFAPALHRFLHRFHLDMEEEDSRQGTSVR
jgi:hypothetical protein